MNQNLNTIKNETKNTTTETSKPKITEEQRKEGAAILAVKFAAFCTPMGL